jgi:4'-phosphopantetheinyl transferase
MPFPPPPPGPGEVHVWRVPLDGPAPGPADGVLSAAETARAARLLLDRDRRRWTAARRALRVTLAHYTGIPPARITLEYGPHGKPRLAGQPRDGLRFSLSHSRDRALLAVCRGAPVGVDLEHRAAGPPDGPGLDDLAAVVLAPPELARYLRLPPARRRAALLRHWTGKEAVLKATGRGVTLPGARRVAVPSGSGRPGGVPGRWSLLRPRPGPGYLAALAVPGKDWTLVHIDAAPDSGGDPDASPRRPSARPGP